ncbi:hypothetical protein BC832DRAFT_279766 [Gaertneriomyces semiglobifer]|nr:hypothetical protein BC832DRAFT_279766 [Gaertneriomyces semiglobifer]
MSSLTTFLQNELLSLSSEARRKNPEIKEAAERLLYILRGLKEKSAAATPDGQDPVTAELAKNDEVLRPFLLSCETKNPKLIPIAVGCLQRLITHQAVPESSVMHILQALSDLINSSVELQLKILQTVLPLLTNYRNVHGNVLAEALLLCFRLQETKSPIVNNTAAATVRQLVTFVFDKFAAEDIPAAQSLPASDASRSGDLSPSGRDACALFEDLCLLTSGEPPNFLPLQALPKNFGLELIEAVISSYPQLFRKHSELSDSVKEKVCPLLIKSFSDRVDFPLACRLMRVVHSLLKQYHDILVMECEIFLSMFCKLLEPDHAPIWQRVLVMEVLRSICVDGELLRFIYRSYDDKDHTTKVFTEMITAFRRIVVSEKPALLLHAPTAASTESIDTETQEQYALTASTAAVKLQCIDQLDKTEPPAIPETYIIYLALQCISGTVESEAHFAMPLLSKTVTPEEEKPDILLAIEMANSSWAGILAALSFLVNASVDDEIFATVIRAYQNITGVVGLLGLTSHRDAFLASLIKSCVPSHPASSDTGAHLKAEALHPASLQAVSRGLSVLMNDRNVVCVRALIAVAHALTPVLEDKAWYSILETLQTADKYINTGKTGRQQSSLALFSDGRDARPRSGSIAQGAPVPQQNAMENQFLSLLIAAKKLFESTQTMEDKNLSDFLRAICRLARNTAVGSATSASAAGPTAKDAPSKSADDRSFAISKLHDVALSNVSRLISPDSEFEMWDMIIGELVNLSHCTTCPVSIRTQVCQTIGDVICAAVRVADLGQPAVEMKILEPLKRWALINSSTTGPGMSAMDAEERDRIVRSPWFVDIQRSTLETLNKILQTSGQHLSAGWPLVVEVIRSIVNSRISRARALTEIARHPVEQTHQESLGQSESAAAPASKGTALVRVAFPCLQLICTDFMSLLSPQVLHQVIEALGSFGSQMDDLNIGLTAVGLLWSVSDFVLTQRQSLEKGDGQALAQTTADDVSIVEGLPEAPLDSPKGADFAPVHHMKRSTSACIAMLKDPLSSRTMDALWMLLLGHLSRLCADSRPEVRNSANQTLFRTIGMNGGKLTMEAWGQCIWDVLFPLMERVQNCSEAADVTRPVQQVSPVMADPGTPTTAGQSKSAIQKQWDDTKVITLQGITKCLLDFLPVLVKLDDGFDRSWVLFLDYIKNWCLSGSPEVSIAAVKSLRALVQYPKTVGDIGVPDIVASRLPNLMRVAWDVWIGIGRGVVANSDEEIAAAGATVADDLVTQPSNKDNEELQPTRLLHGPFTQDTLATYISVFPDIYDMIKPTFQLFEIRGLLRVLSQLLLYHTNIPPGTTPSRLRGDFINDLDTPSPLQSAVLELISGDTLDKDAIPGAPEVCLVTVAGFIRLPFVRNVALPQVPPLSVEKPPGFTYMALSKRSMQVLVVLFDKYARMRSIYSSGTFEKVISAVGLPMRAKYNCPPPGVKDSTPLWRAAANTCMTIVRLGLDAMTAFITELPQEVLRSVYSALLDTFEGILLPSSEPPAELSVEELAADEDFDISVLTNIESELIPHMGQPHAPEPLLVRLVGIVRDGSRLYSTAQELASDAALPLSLAGVAPVRPVAEQQNVAGSLPGGGTTAASVERATTSSSLHRKFNGDIIPVTRERFATSCLGTLFRLCSSALEDDSNMRFRVAEAVAPVLVEKCKDVIGRYIADKQLYGKMPLPRIRNEEIILVIKHLVDLQIRPRVLVRYLGENKMRTYSTYRRSILYITMC